MTDPVESLEISAASAEDAAALRRLIGLWFDAWSPGAAPWHGKQLLDVFAPGEGAIAVIDDMGGKVVTFSSVQSYLDFWRPWMAGAAADWSIAPHGAIEVTVDGGLAVASFAFDAVGRTPAGDAIELRPAQYGTHVYRKTANGWRLLREHLTTVK